MSHITPQWAKMNPFEAAARINELERENAALRAALQTALAIESLDEANLEELIARCRCIMRQTKEAKP